MRKYTFIFSITLALLIVTTFIRQRNVVIETPVSFIFFLIAVLITIRKSKLAPSQVLLGFIISSLLIHTAAAILDGTLPNVGAPNILMQLVGILCGYLIAGTRVSPSVKAGIPIIFLVVCGWYILDGYKYWFQYISYGTFTGKVEKKTGENWYVVDKQHDTLSEEGYKDKIVLFDFWQTSCYNCYARFPDLEALYQKYKNDTRVVIQAVNIPIERDGAGEAFNVEKGDKKYSFPCVAGNDAMAQQFNINAYPTTILIKNNEVVFLGDIRIAGRALDKLLQ